MKKYDDIVVGSGASGLTMALLLGMNGRSVLLLEKNNRIGGSLSRFYKEGIPFDTGFHFTGGFYKGGILHDILTVLGIHDRIEPIFLSQEGENQFILEAEGKVYQVPPGIENYKTQLKKDFPGEKSSIDRYFSMIKSVCDRTVSMDLRKISISSPALEEDFISLTKVLNQLTDDRALKGLLSGYSMCYGVRPDEISFANHSRVCYGMYESIARVKDGGEAIIRAFRESFKKLDIEIGCSRYITDCVDIQNKKVGRFILNNGDEVTADHCILTIHPRNILDTLPREYLSKAFISRVMEFESSAGFFYVFGIVESDNPKKDLNPTIISLFPTSDINKLLDPGYRGRPALVIMRSLEEVKGKIYQMVNAFEPSFPEEVRAWKDSKTGHRSGDYENYKQRHIDSIKDRIVKLYPEYIDSFKVVEAASILTFRDYLNSPDGSAYGIKQKIGQFNLFGKLPLCNMYAAGQSSLLPGLVGAMMSSFIVGRSIIGKDRYNQFIRERLQI